MEDNTWGSSDEEISSDSELEDDPQDDTEQGDSDNSGESDDDEPTDEALDFASPRSYVRLLHCGKDTVNVLKGERRFQSEFRRRW